MKKKTIKILQINRIDRSVGIETVSDVKCDETIYSGYSKWLWKYVFDIF